jgi:signal transduction histidine kinase
MTALWPTSRSGASYTASTPLAVVAMLAVALGIASAALTVLSEHAELRAVGHPSSPAMELLIGWSFVAAGLVARYRRAGNRFGSLLCAVGFAWFLSSLLAANSALWFSVGLVVSCWWLGIFLHATLAFPSGRLETPARRAVVLLYYVDVVVVQLAWVLFSRPSAGSGCSGCPNNVFLLEDRPRVASSLLLVEQPLVGSAVIAAALYILVQQWRHATGPQRRVVGPVVVSASVCLLVLGVTTFAEPFSYAAGQAIGWAGGVAFIAVPVVFLAGLVRQRLDRSTVGQLVAELSDLPGGQGLGGVLRRSLKDPSLRVAYWKADVASYVDELGKGIELPVSNSLVGVTLVEREGQQVAALVHDASLADDPALVTGVGAAAGLALENERLHLEVREQLEELRASRLRIVEAGDLERRRLERNLHDGAQQRLLALSLLLGEAERASEGRPQVQVMLKSARAELARSLVELRDLALGIHPAVLADHGLVVTLEGVAARAPFPVALTVDLTQRPPFVVEVAVYYLICEALSNTAKHARASSAQVNVKGTGDSIYVEVKDDGIGGADSSRGSGLHGLSDRVATLGGQLNVSSGTGSGTCVQAVIPCV